MAARGAYQTKQQEAVEKLFQQRPEECLTPEEAYAALEEQGLTIGKTTVYRAIARLCEGGTLRRYTSHESGEAALYQYSPCQESHMHLRCVDCGALEHLHCEEIEALKEHLSQQHGFSLDEGQTVLYGRCGKCSRERREK